MTPVLLMTDGYIANGSAPWKIQSVNEMPEINNMRIQEFKGTYHPYERDKDSLARSWAVPGTPGLEHRVGGLEKDKVTGNVSYVPENHEYMTRIRAEKVKRVQNYIPDQETEFADSGDLLVVGWGGTYGSLHSAVKHLNEEGFTKIGFAHFHYLNPLPKNTDELFKRFKKIVICELNTGQFIKVLKANYTGHEFLQFNKIQGLPFANNELKEKFKQILS